MQAEINNNGWRHLGQSEQRKSSVLFPIQSQKSPDSGFLHICEKKRNYALLPKTDYRDKGRGRDLRLTLRRRDELQRATNRE